VAMHEPISNEVETTESDFLKVKNAPDAVKEFQSYRRKEPITNSLMTPERYGSESIGYSVTKHTSPKSGKSYYYKSPLTGVKGLGLLEPRKFYKNRYKFHKQKLKNFKIKYININPIFEPILKSV
jgi:hypothetical protein